MDNFTLKIVAGLDKVLSKRMIKSDLKTFDGQFTVKVIASLNKVLSQRALKQTLKELTNLNVNVNAKLNKSTSEAQLRQQVRALQAKIEDLDVRLKANTEQLNATVRQAASSAQRVADQVPIEYKVSIKKDKLISDLSLLAKQNSKLFTNSAATQKYGKLLDDAYGATTGGDISELTLRMAAFKSELKATNLSGLTLTDTFKKTVGRAGELVSATSMVMVAYSQARKAYTEVKALDDSMTSLYKVADEIRSRDDFPAYLDKAIVKAKQLSVETKSLISSVTDWKKIGFGLGLSEELAEVSTKLEKTGDMSIEKSTSTLISTLQAFKEIDGLTEEQYSERALAIADKINHISNTRSIDAEGISDALQNSVATLQEANNDLNQSIALISAGNKIFQSPSEVGNMIKIVSMRLRGVSEDGEEAEESVAKLRDIILNLTNDKVDIMLDENTFKSTYDILLEISKVYDSLSDKSQALLLEKISGKQRGASTAALLQNMSEAEAIYQDALNSTGSVNKEFERYQESASAAVIRFKETLVDTYTSILSGDMIKGAADTGSAILELANKFNLLQSSIIGITAVGAVKGITAIGTACLSSAKQMSALGDAINRVNSLPSDGKARTAVLKSIGEETRGLTDKQNKLLLSNKNLETSDRMDILAGQGVIKSKREEKLATLGLTQATDAQTAANVKATTSTFSLKAAVTGLGASMKAIWQSNKLGISLMAASVLVGAFVSQYQKYRQELEETRQKNIEAADSASAQVNKLKDLYNQYINLTSITNRTTSQEQELQKAVEDITAVLGDKAKILEGLTVGTQDYTDALKEATKAELEGHYATAVRGRKAAEENLSEDVWSNWDGSQVDVPLNVNMTGVENHVKALGIVRDMLSEFEKETSRGINWAPENYEDMDSVVDYYHALIEARERLTLQSKELGDDSILDSDIYKNMDNAISQISENIDTYTKRRYEELKMEYEFHNGIPATVDGFNSMKNAILSASGASESLKKAFNDLLTEDFSSLSVQAQQIASSGNRDTVLFDIQNKDTAKFIDDYQKKIATLSTAIDKVKNSTLTGSDLLDLQQEFPVLIDSTDDLDIALNKLVDETLSQVISYLESAGASDGLIEIFRDLANEAKGFKSSSDSVMELTQHIQESYDLLTKIQKEVDKTKQISLDSLNSIAKQYPELTTATAEYAQGLISTSDLMALLEQAYNNDANAFRTAMAAKLDGNEVFFNTIKLNNEGLFTALAKAYGVDVGNWKTMAQAKAEIDQALIQKLGAAWGQYYGVVIDQATGLASLINKTPTTGLTTEQSVDLIVARTNAESMVSSFNHAKEAMDKAAQIEIGLPDFGGIGGKSSTGGSKDKTKEPTIFDFMQNKVDKLDNTIEQLQDQVDTFISSVDKNNTTDTIVDQMIEKMSILQQMHDKYMEEAAKVGLAQEYIDKIQNGTMNQDAIERISDENLVKQIQEYDRFYKSATDTNDKIVETRKNIEKLNLSKLDNIKNQFDNILGAQNDLIDAQKQYLDLRESMGEEIYADDYADLIDLQGELVNKNAEAYNRLANEMSKINLEKGTEEYYKYNEELQKYKNNMMSAASAVKEYMNAIVELEFKGLTDFKSQMDSISNTISTMSDLIGNVGLTDEKGKLTDLGLTKMALYAQQLANSKQEAVEYAEAMNALKDMLDEGLLTQDEYNKRLQDYTSAQNSAVQSTKEAKDAILSLVKDGIQAEIDAKKKLVDETKAALDAERDLHDYQNSISEKQDNISKLERQIAALSNSTNREDIAQRLQLQSQLAEAKKELYELQYDHEIDQRKEALDKEFNDYEESKQKESDELDSNLDAQNAAIEKYLNEVKTKYSTVYGVLNQYGDEYSLAAIEDLTTPWNEGGNAADLCSVAVGDALSNIQYNIDSMDFSRLYEMVDLFNSLGMSNGIGSSGGGDFEDISGQGRWQKGQGGRDWFGENYNPDGDYFYASDGIYTINGKQYGFDDDGYMQTEWQEHDGKQYYFDANDGHMVKSKWIPGKGGSQYYLLADGTMAEDMAIKGNDGSYYYVDDDGKWDGDTLTAEQVRKLGYTIGYKKGRKRIPHDQLAWTQENKPELITRPSDGALLTPLKLGDGVINGDLTQNLLDIAGNPNRFVEDIVARSMPNYKIPDYEIHPVNREQKIEVNMNIGGVLDETAARVLSDRMPEMLKKNHMQITKQVWKDTEYGMMGK
ncbi:phage tail tape measure protein [Enterocloster bolteae]|uniref:phage tail tape measure protein n=1 Tax=Enterocloster bolteae TaxID=208479 RepID=UPI0034B72C8A